MNFGLDKQMERLVEVLALSALLRLETENIHASDILINKYKNQLDKFAFPLEIDLDEDNKAQAAVNELVRKYSK
jgi:hypothetical protein